MSGSGTIQAGAALTLANNVIDNSGTTTLNNNGNSVTLSGVISGAGAFTASGAGTLTLNNANTYVGNTTINAGTVVLENASGIPGGVGYGNVTMNPNTLLNLNGNSVVLNGLNSSTNTTTVDTLTGGSVTLTVGENGASGTFQGSINDTSGSLALVKDGAGTQTLGGTNGYAGGTTINAGTLQVGNGNTNFSGAGMAVGLGSGPVTDNGVLQFNLAGTNVFTNSISGSGGVNLNNTGIYNLTGNNTFTGGITNNGAWLWINQASKLGAEPNTIQSALRPGQIHLDGSAGNLSFDSGITFVLSGDNGVLINNAGSNTIAGQLQMTGGAGNTYLVASNGVLAIAGQISTVVGAPSPRTLTLGGPANGLISGQITDGIFATSVTKTDGGTWDLSYAGNNYSGATTVSGGTLIIDAAGNNTGNGAIAVNSGGTMIVNGENYGSGAVTVASNGTLGGVGQIYSAVTFQTGANGAFTTSDSGSTPLNIWGNVTLNNNPITVYVAGGTPLTPGTYILLQQNNGLDSITGLFSSTATITGAGLAIGSRATVTTSSSQVALVVVANSTWTNNANGNWTTGANWDSNPNYPSSAGQVATFGVGTSLITVDLNASETVGGVNFTNSNSFVITNAANVLTMDNGGYGANINVTAGTANSIGTGISLNDATSVTVNTSAVTALSVPGSVNGGSALIIAGNGILTLSGANTYSGNTTLSGGELVLGSTNALGSGTFTISGGSLDSSVTNLVTENNNAQNWNTTNITFLGSQNLNLGSGNVTMNSSVTVNVNSNQLTVGGPISGAYALTFQGTNNSILELDGANGFTGNLNHNGGVLSVGSDSATGAGILDINTAGSIIKSADSTTHTIPNTLGMTGNGIYTTGTGNLIFSGGVVSYNYSKVYDITNPVTTLNFSFPAGAAGSTKNGPGTLVLSGANANSGGVTVNNGTLAMGDPSALGTGTLIMNGGGLDSTVADLVNANNNVQTWNGSFYFAGSQNLNLGTGSVTLSANTAITVSNNTLEVDGAISGSAKSLTKAGAGTLVLFGVNTYSNTIVNAGTLEIGQATLNTSSSVSISNGATLKLDFAVTNTVGALVLNGITQPGGVYGSGTPGGYITGTGFLQVAVSGPTGPAHLTNSVSGSTLSLSWPAGQGWRLQMQTNSLSVGLGTNWFYITDGSLSITNITTDPSKPTVFYRLTYP